ncbi:MAG TPA: peptide deformylase [Chthonomonadaceae bacterium]|nr:peptide deformylase [Chthonomonadaceae bacterium]
MTTSTLTAEGLQVPDELKEAWSQHPAIVKLGDPILRAVARPVGQITRETRQLIDRMTKIMREAHGLGLAAPQVGVSTRVILYDAGEGLRVLINPRIVTMRGEQLDPPEGCLSIPGLQGQVRRALEIKVEGFDQRGKPVTRRATEMEARVIQHEIDHLDGVLFIDKVDPATLEWVIGPGEDDDGNAAPRE